MPGGGEQGADQAVPAGGDAGEAPEPGAPGEVEEDGLGVVVGGVGGGDQIGTRLLGGPAEKGIAQDAGGLFNARPGAGGLFPHIALFLVQFYRGKHPPVG